MARRGNTDVEDVEQIETEEIEETSGPEASGEGDAPKGKTKKEPARGDLPEGYTTPVGLAKVLTDRQLHHNRAGEVAEVRPQMVYSYMKNAPQDDKFPVETVTDSLGKERQAVKVEAGVEWWQRKNARVEQRKANAAEKAEKKAQRAAQKEAEASAEAEGGEQASAEEVE